MKRTAGAFALPQAAFNPKFRPDPRQAADPSLHKIVLRRQWVPKKWHVGEDPWEMDVNSVKGFSKRNLADVYADKVRACLGFADAVPYFLELKERDIPPTTTFMNLYLAAAQRYKFIADVDGRRADVWHIYKELSTMGAKPDINTLDLLRNTMHSVCYEYCEAVKQRIIKSDHAKVTAGLHKALMDVSEMAADDINTFINSFAHSGSENAVVKAAGSESAETDLVVQAAYASGSPRAVMKICEDFLTAERERRSCTDMLSAHESALQGDGDTTKRLSNEQVRRLEEDERRQDLAKGQGVQSIVGMLKDPAVLTRLAEHDSVQKLTEAEVVTGSVPRRTKSGKAIHSEVVTEWEGTILIDSDLKEMRSLISMMRRHLIEGYNLLCKEQVQRQGAAGDHLKIDNQDIIEEVLRRYRSALRALCILNIYEADRIAPLRAEIIADVSLPITLSQHADAEGDVTIGCYIEIDRMLPVNDRSQLSLETARIGLSYYQPTSMLPGGISMEGLRRNKSGFDVLQFCMAVDIVEPADLSARYDSKDTRAVARRLSQATQNRKGLNTTHFLSIVRREAARRDPAVHRVLVACAERIIERGSANTQPDLVMQLADLAYLRAHLWPSSELNNSFLTMAATSTSSVARKFLSTLPFYTVKNFDDVVNHVRSEMGLLAGRSPVTSDRRGKVQRNVHMFSHPVFTYADSGVDDEFFGLYFRARPWEDQADKASDTDEVFRLYRDTEKEILDKWEESVGLARGTEGKALDHRGVFVDIAAGDVPLLAAKWEDRYRKLTSTHTYEAMLQIVFDEEAAARALSGTTGAKAYNKYKIHGSVREVIRLMRQHNVQPGQRTYALILSLCSRAPDELSELRYETLKEMKSRGKEFWWQWFEEI
ncbi:excreted/secreted protein 15 [Diplonema papillatum]|nr:excreted/secreted protein 15 [Diplonema papillatum]